MKNLEVRQPSAMGSEKCGRKSKNTGLLKKYPLLVVTGLLLWTATAWGQQLFGDRIYGSAVACVGNHYSKTGSTKHGYDLTGKTADSCKYGSANAASKAQIGPPVISASTTAISKKGGYSEGAGSADSYDEAILNPPNGFQGDSVPVTLETAYQFDVTSTAPGSALYEICWTITDITQHCVDAASGSGRPKLRMDFKVPGGGSTFQFQLAITGQVDGIFLGSASFKTFDVALLLPTGWTYAWASDSNGYGHQTSHQP
jgi:hypothetical protein